MTPPRRSAPLLLAVALSIFASACGKPGDGARTNDDHRKQQAGQVMDDTDGAETARINARFDEVRSNSNLIRGQVLQSAKLNCFDGSARIADDRLYVRVVQPMHGYAGHLQVVLKDGGSGYISADFIDTYDRTERILKLNLISKDFPTAQPLDFKGQLVLDVADLVETLHAKCFSSKFKRSTSFLLLSPEIVRD